MSSKQPNILWICAEHQRFDTIAALGNRHVRTPSLDRLVSEGVAFTHAYCQSPVCTPSRSSFLTGRYPVTTRCRQNGQDLPESEVIFPRRLDAMGYRCGLVGKLHLCSAYSGAEKRLDDGYTGYSWSHGTTAKHGGAWVEWLHSQGYAFDEVYQASPVIQSRRVIARELHQSTWCVDRALDWMRSSGDQPWMISLNPFAAHDPFDYLQDFYERYDPETLPLPAWREGELDDKPLMQKQKSESGSGFDMLVYAETTERQRREMVAAYYATIEHLDAEIGRVLAELDASGERENTLVLYHADHGELLGDHGLFAKGPFFYEPSVRVPLIFSWPGKILQDRRRSALVELVDIAPTIYELLSLAVPEEFQGRSLANLLTDVDADDRHREGVYCESYNASPTQKATYATMWRDRRFKMVVHHGTELGELYDLEADPHEFINLWQNPDFSRVRAERVLKCFDNSVFTMDPLPLRKAGF